MDSQPIFVLYPDLIELHREMCAQALTLMQKKNHDYSQGVDPFRNFRSALAYGVQPEIGIIVRMGDKLRRVETFVALGDLKVKDESFQDSLLDVINYSILASGLFTERIMTPDAGGLTRGDLFDLHEELSERAERYQQYLDPGRSLLDMLLAIEDRLEKVALLHGSYLFEQCIAVLTQCIAEAVLLAWRIKKPMEFVMGDTVQTADTEVEVVA